MKYVMLPTGAPPCGPSAGVRQFVLNFGDDTNGIADAEAKFFTLHSKSGTPLTVAASQANRRQRVYIYK